MEVNCYDDVCLKDGREGCVIEIYKHPIKDGYEIELSDKPDDSVTVTVTLDDIEKVIHHSKEVTE